MYEVQLPAFQGPLELLLHLIEKRQLDITTLSLVDVTEQYLEHIRSGDQIDMDSLADFLVIAAKLLYLKSVSLLPRPPVQDTVEEEDPGEELTRLLEDYRKFRSAAGELKLKYEKGYRAYPRLAPAPRPKLVPAPLELTLPELTATMDKVLKRMSPVAATIVERRRITIADRIELLRTMLASGAPFTFGSFIADCTSRESIAVSFLSVLELIKMREVEVRQETLFGEIIIRPAGVALDRSAGV